jgi:GntR family trehalose operon transcriptional repressor
MKTNKFIAVYHEWAEMIKQGEIPPLSKLPSENELAQKHGTSRETIRKALQMLAENGYIQKIRGKGSVVLDVSKLSFPVSGLVSFQELAKSMGKETRTIVHKVEIIKPDERLQQSLHAKSSDEVWKVLRVREIESEKVILDKDFFMRSFVPSLTKEICEGSIYEYLENDLGLPISFAKKEIVVEEATEEDKSVLDLDGFTHIVVVKNTVYLEDASLFQYTESRHRLDKFRFVDFARRRS